MIYRGKKFHINKDGYYQNSRVGLLHRYIYETEMRCSLLPNVIVHHKDEKKLNNDIDNLVCMTRKEHNRLHNPNLGKKRSEEYKLKLSQKAKERGYSNTLPSQKGVKRSEETKRRLSESKRRRCVIA